MQNICRKQYLVVESVYMLPNARRASFEFFICTKKITLNPETFSPWNQIIQNFYTRIKNDHHRFEEKSRLIDTSS